MDTYAEYLHFSDLLDQVPLEFKDHLITAWDAVYDAYPIQSHQMPQPAWRSGYENSNDRAWDQIQYFLSENQLSTPISIYLHIPFCKGKKCGFCDCLSVAIKDKAIVAHFVETLKSEIKWWSCLPHVKKRPVTIIYFGGGTPNSLPDSDFEQIMEMIFEEFNITPETQISVECPGKLLSSRHLQFLQSLHVKRISVGIQSLEEPLRFDIGRNTDSAQLLSALSQCKKMGFITSGDLIYGLPDQTISGFIQSIRQLVDIGINGLSLYRFVVSFRNREFVNQRFKNYKKDEIRNYILFQIGHQILTEAGYHKNHFIHFEKGDANLYYRHLLRDEDLIALGPTADGIVGPYRYRHPPLEEYLSTNGSKIPMLEGGVKESENSIKIKAATVQLMCGELENDTIKKLNLSTLVDRWQACRIVARSDMNTYQLLANGSWLIHRLLDQVDEFVNQ